MEGDGEGEGPPETISPSPAPSFGGGGGRNYLWTGGGAGMVLKYYTLKANTIRLKLENCRKISLQSPHFTDNFTLNANFMDILL